VVDPARVDVVFVVRELLAIVHGPHPGPVIRINAPAGKNPLPLIVNVNDTPAVGALGVVLRLEMTGIGATTRNGNALELPPPLGFVTFTLHVSGSLSVVIVIVSCVLLMNATSLLVRTFEPPVHVTVIVGGLAKFVPLMVIVCGLVEPVTGFGLTLLIAGVTAPLLTVMLLPVDCGPGPPVCASKPF